MRLSSRLAGPHDAWVTIPVLFVQGAGAMSAPDGSGILANYLSRELGPHFDVDAPEMPDADSDPNYQRWATAISDHLDSSHEPAVLVGHSLGGSVLLKYLSNSPQPTRIAGIFLVSMPWWGSEGWGYEEYGPTDGFASKLLKVPIFLYNSRYDREVPYDHQAFYRERIPGAIART